MELSVDLGPMPVDQLSGCVVDASGFQALLDRAELCDVLLVVGDQCFPAHSLVLAATSPAFHQQLQQERNKGGYDMIEPQDRKPVTIHMQNVSHKEAVQDMIARIYEPLVINAEETFCRTENANRDALVLAQTYQIPQLQNQVSRWLLRDLTSHNVLERLAICEEFGLGEVREKLLELLIADPVVLHMLISSPEVIKVPRVLQDLLVRVLTSLGLGGKASPRQKPKKAPKGAVG